MNAHPDPLGITLLHVGITWGILATLVLAAWLFISRRQRVRGRWTRHPAEHTCKRPYMAFHHVGDQWTCYTCDTTWEIVLLPMQPGPGGLRRDWKEIKPLLTAEGPTE